MAKMDGSELSFLQQLTASKTRDRDNDVAIKSIGEVATARGKTQMRAVLQSMEAHYYEVMEQRGASIPEEAKWMMASMLLFCRMSLLEHEDTASSLRTLFDQHP